MRAKRPTLATHLGDPPPATHLWDIYIRLWDQNSNMVSFCVFTFLRLKVFSTFTLQKKIVERFWGYRVLERIKTHRLSTTPALYDPQTYEFFRFYEKKPFSIFDVYPSYFDRIPEFFRPNFRARQRATFMFLINFWAS